MKSLAAFGLPMAFAGSCGLAAAQPAGAPGSGGPGMGEGPPRHGPPPEAIAACSGKAPGAACSFTGRRGDTLTGVCFAPRAGGPQGGNTPPPKPASAGSASQPPGAGQGAIACRPEGPPPAPPNGAPPKR